MFRAHYSGEKTTSNAEEAFAFLEKSRFGERQNEIVEYAGVEALFLVQEKKMEIISGKNPLSFHALVSKLQKKDKKIATKYAAYKDLRKRGYIVKTALKFGAEFRVYEKGVEPGEDHARWILYTVREHDALNWHDFAAKNRVAHAVKKNLLIAIVDDENDVSYYEISWTRP